MVYIRVEAPEGCILRGFTSGAWMVPEAAFTPCHAGFDSPTLHQQHYTRRHKGSTCLAGSVKTKNRSP
jgi:hypothetical protein